MKYEFSGFAPGLGSQQPIFLYIDIKSYDLFDVQVRSKKSVSPSPRSMNKSPSVSSLTNTAGLVARCVYVVARIIRSFIGFSIFLNYFLSGW